MDQEGGTFGGQAAGETAAAFLERVCEPNLCAGEYEITSPVWEGGLGLHNVTGIPQWRFAVLHTESGRGSTMTVELHDARAVIRGLPPLVESEPAHSLVERLFGRDAPDYVVISRFDAFEVWHQGTAPWHTNPRAGTESQVEAGFAAIQGQGVISLDGSSGLIPFECPRLLDRSGALLVLDRCFADEYRLIELTSGEPATLRATPPGDGVDGEWWGFIERGGTVLEVAGDAEGNLGAVTNEGGSSLIGEDYPGHTILSADGAWLVYGDHRGRVSPHWTNVVVVRDVRVGSEIGRWELPGVLTCLESDGKWVLVCLAPEESVIGALQIVHDVVAAVHVASGEIRLVETRARVYLPTAPGPG